MEQNVAEEIRYRISPRRLGEMVAVAGELESDLPFAKFEDTGPPIGLGRLTSIGKYRFVQVVGSGGMGTVYEATDEYSGRKVAIKVSLDSDNPELLARFEREAMIMNRLNHPNIVRLFDWGKEGTHIYIAMEYLDGITLEDMIRGTGKLRLNLALAIVGPVVDAVDYVHQQGFVRNDIKPSNIILTVAGRVCLLDFGITRPLESDTELASKFSTQTGVIIGTPQFMAPEQLQHLTADRRADIYSLGVMLYRMLTARFPFEGAVSEVVRAQIQDAVTPPSQLVSTLPAEVDAVVLKCLEKDREKRFETMEQLGQALKNIAKDLPSVDLKFEVGVVGKQVKEVAKMDQEATGRAAVSLRDVLPATDYAAPAPIPSMITEAGPVSKVSHDTVPAEPTAEFKLPLGLSAADDFVPVDGLPRLALLSGQTHKVWMNITLMARDPNPSYPLTSRISIGRSSDNAITLRDTRVSRYQAEVTGEGRYWYIEDFNSNLGTFVNDEKIISRRLLKNRDIVTIADYVFIFTQAAAQDPLAR